MKGAKARVLLAKMGLDSHDIGIKLIARWLTDAGMEVVFLGSLQMPQSVVNSAMQEDIDVIGLSFLSGEHMYYVPQILRQMRAVNLCGVSVIVGGVIPGLDAKELKEMGVAEVFLPDTPMTTIVDFIASCAGARYKT